MSTTVYLCPVLTVEVAQAVTFRQSVEVKVQFRRKVNGHPLLPH